MTDANIDLQPQANTSRDPQEVVQAYFAAGNNSSVDAAVALFTDDAVVMAEGWETATGRTEIQSLLARVLSPTAFRRNLQVDVDDVLQSHDVAAIRTHSTGTMARLEYGATVDLPYRELFVLRLSGGSWLIAAYMFNSATAER